ncbi:Oxidoreductase vrtI [Penicillium rolfsii]|nr:Oxidoreductase vrtI [Penicillium rolfsii]
MSNLAAVATDLLAASGSLSASQVQRLFQITKDLYNLPRKTRSAWAADHHHAKEMIFGHKEAGFGPGPVEGRKDGFEGFMIFEHPLWNVQDPATMVAPRSLQQNSNILQANISALRTISLAILDSLSQSLGLRGNSHLTSTRRPSGFSNTSPMVHLKMLGGLGGGGGGHIAHTDAGSLSFVFTDVPGLQVALPGTDEWAYILPREGHVIVKVGDSLHLLSRGRLRSSLHRVVPYLDALNRTKYTIVYLVRPETEAVFIDGDGKGWKSKDWYLKKFEVFGKEVINNSVISVVTGRENYDGRWNPR